MTEEQYNCDNCNGSDQATVVHGKEQWCLDCMRSAGHCISCDVYLPDIVDDYYNYEHDECPKCNDSNNPTNQLKDINPIKCTDNSLNNLEPTK